MDNSWQMIFGFFIHYSGFDPFQINFSANQNTSWNRKRHFFHDARVGRIYGQGVRR